jgi:hypothetical protein
MLKRVGSTSSWPRLIGIASGTFGAASTVATLAQFSVRSSLPTHTFTISPQLIASLCGCAFFVLAFPLYTGREWARRALVLTTYSILAALAIFLSLHIFRQPYYSGFRSLIAGCALVTFLTPGAFFLAVLHHADVKRAFQSQDASNQSLEPTADRHESPLP